MGLSWPQLSGYVTWSSSQGQHDELCQVSGGGHRRQGRKNAEKGKRGLSFLSRRPPGTVSYLPGVVGLLRKAGQRLNGSLSKDTEPGRMPMARPLYWSQTTPSRSTTNLQCWPNH